MTPSQNILAHLGNGPRSDLALIATFLANGMTYEKSKTTVKTAMLELIASGDAEEFKPGIYRLSARSVG